MTEHRWNARQFAKYVQRESEGLGTPRLIWVTEAALLRGIDAWRQGALDILQVPLPAEPLVIGLEKSVGDPLASARIIALRATAQGRELVREYRGFDDADVVEDARVVLGFEPGGRVDRSCEFLTSAYGGSPRVGEEQFIPAGDGVVPPAYGGDPVEYARDQLILRVNIALVTVWALVNEPQAQDDAALTVERAPITVGKKRKRREYDVSLVDVKRSTAPRSAPSGRVIERDHRWGVIGHWKNQRYGKGNALVKRIYREPYVCGPPDKPLVRRPKVSVLR
ncbi:hypothetical protein [Mycobacteroides abscessus]|uniref:hypothetical protein n=1 Tax=Mycobacteroides abscessus TaxID=36809 RepID=UPI00092B9E2A|nr:hypothetical protein [Mycobacteroides abscessus]SIF34888.1 Uncharacterised protein [Mycobacteroides abscessus subsp. abscessus]